MSSTTTASRRNAAVPQDPACGPIGWPSTARMKRGRQARRGAVPQVHAIAVEQQDGAQHAGTLRLDHAEQRVERVCSGAPRAISSRIWFWSESRSALSRADRSARFRSVISWKKIDSPSGEG